MNELDITNLRLIKYALEKYKVSEGWSEIHKGSIMITLKQVESIINNYYE